MVNQLRLDMRISKSTPYEMAQPAPRLAWAARAYRPIVSIIQCSVASLPILNLAIISKSDFSLLLIAGFFTALYMGIYIMRWLPISSVMEGNRWVRSQVASNVAEITLLGVLGIFYSGLQLNHAYYWWALYILPIFRLGETAGAMAWVGGLGLVSALLIGESSIDQLSMGNANWIQTLAEIFLLVLSTFMPFYILNLLDLCQDATHFWRLLVAHFATSTPSTSEIVGHSNTDLQRNVFKEALEDFVPANFGVLWELDLDNGDPILRAIHKYTRKHKPRTFFEKWFYVRRDHGKLSNGEETIPVDDSLWKQNNSADFRFIAQSKNPKGPDNSPWLASKLRHIRSWSVLPIYVEENRRPVGFLEIGFAWELGETEWLSFENRAIAVAEALGGVFELDRQSRGQQLRQELNKLEQMNPYDTSFYTSTVKALFDYFRRPVLLVTYSTGMTRIESVVGKIYSDPDKSDSRKIELIQTLLRSVTWVSQQASGTISRLGHDDQQSTRTTQECFFVAPLLSRGTTTDLLILMEHTDHLTYADQQMLRDAAGMISLVITRQKIADLVQFGQSDWNTSNLSKKLRAMAERVREQSGADLVVLYEFNNGRPLLPTFVGTLKDEEYLKQKPIIIEDPNPILRVARMDEPWFCEQVRALPIGSGVNRHGDPVFTIREEIVSSVGLPLKTWHGVVGVMWLNFRAPQKFDELRRPWYRELVKQVPHALEQLRMVENVKSQAEERTREYLRLGFHNTILQGVMGANIRLGTVNSLLKAGQVEEAINAMAEIRNTLSEAEQKTRDIFLEDMRTESPSTELAWHLDTLKRQFHSQFGYPDNIIADGLDEIPPMLCNALLSVIEEAVRNAAKHGKAKQIFIQASNEDGLLEILIKDDGCGFEPRPEIYGGGIRSMQSRLNALNGKVRIASKKEEGSCVAIEIPLP